MKNQSTRKKILTSIAILAIGSVSFAQSTTDVAKVNSAVKVIDNKGTVKYFQSSNGITQIVNTTADKTTTTWQLGGTLTDNTYIDVDGKVFGLNGIALETGPSSTDATSESDSGTGTGWTLLVRDEATGAIRKMLATSLVQSGYGTDTAAADDANVVVTVTGVPTDKSKVFVFRNGAKLLNADFTITTDTVTVNYNAVSLPIYTGDIVEVQFVK